MSTSLKISKISASGSYLSDMNLREQIEKINYNSDPTILKEIGIDNSGYIMGFNRSFKTIKTSNGSLRVRKKTFDDHTLFDFDGLLVLKTRLNKFINPMKIPFTFRMYPTLHRY